MSNFAENYINNITHMKSKVFIAILILALSAKAVDAQNQETADSLSHQLEEVVITAKQPATKLIGTTLVSTIPGSNLA